MGNHRLSNLQSAIYLSGYTRDSFTTFDKKLDRERRNKVILLVDDDLDMVEIGKKIIETAGYRFISASNGPEALERLLEKKPHLMLLDWMLPGKSGYEVLQELATNEKYESVRSVPVIMLTAKTEFQVDRRELFEMGLSAFLVKPFGGRELINVIDNVFILDQLKKRNIELEKKIRKAEYKYQDLIENASDLIFTINRDARFLFINKRLAALTDYTKDNWLNKPITDLIVEEDKPVMLREFKKTLDGKSTIFEMRIRTKHGKIKYLSTNLNPIKDNGRVIGGVGISRDVTQQKQLEQQIRELKNFNESIIQSMGSGLMTIDQEYEITSFNNGAEEILGFTSDQVLGKRLDEVFSPEETRLLKLALENPDSSQNHMRREMELHTSENRKIYIGFRVGPRIDNTGKQVGSIISFRDITEIKQMQAEVIRMDRLASLGVLASGIAHEIRNPLAGIKTVAQTLEEEIEPGDNKREYLARIVRQVNRLDELLRAFFSYARPKPPVRKFYPLSDIVNEVTALIRQRMEKSNIRLVENYARGLPLIYVDYHQIQQVLFNLFLNAIDAMDEGGELKITADTVSTTINRHDRRGQRFPVPAHAMQYARVAISDTGSGISAEDLQQIYDPFFTTKPHGSGLGLSIVYRIIEEHRGDIRVSSTKGVGTTFTLLLPTEDK